MDGRNFRQVCRASQEEAAGTPVLVNGAFDRQEHIRSALHFIDDRTIQVAYERNWVAFGRGQCCGIVESPGRRS